MRLIRALSLSALLATLSLHAQSTVPALTQAFPSQNLAPGDQARTIDVSNFITVPGVLRTNEFARFDTVLGQFSVELRKDAAPLHVANFLTYAQAGDYNHTFIHRSGLSATESPRSIVQGGGYAIASNPFSIGPLAPRGTVNLEYNLPNARGTLAAARTGNPNSASNEWFFNTGDNSVTLGPANDGFGYTVFGRVLGTGMSVLDAIAALPVAAINPTPPFGTLPVRNYSGGNPVEANLVVINSVTPATLYPTGGGISVLQLAVQNSAPAVVTTLLSGSTLTMTPVGVGSATITVRATDTNGATAEGSFTVTVAAGAPSFIAQPTSQTVASGSTVVFNAPASNAGIYRWERNGVEIPGATSATLVINNASSVNEGRYVSFAVNGVASVSSDTATLTVANTDAVDVGHLVNLSILTSAGAGDKVLTMGAFVGGSTSGALPLVVRAVGPTLGQAPFNIGGVLADPVMDFYAAGGTAPLESNDNWGGGATLSAAFRSVAAFDLPATSLDAAIARTAPGVSPGGYTVQVAGKGTATGTVIAEMYDASGAARTLTTPRLTNLSTRAQIDPNTDLAVGFVLGGTTARTVLVRGVGPSLSAFGISGLMADPHLALFDNSNGRQLAANEDWAGSLEVATASASVGAFPLTGPTSKDAVLLVTLPPGQYSARIAGANGAGGTAIVEVYEVP